MTNEDRSLSEMHKSVHVPRTRNWFRRLLAFAGPAYLVSVGYMDQGNWATDLAGGAKFGYQLVWVLLMSNLMAVLLQTLSARLGVVTGRDLAQACRDFYPRFLVWPLWILCEIAIVACDLAEVLGAAIGLQLLFGIPLIVGVIITVLDVFLLLALSHYGIRRLEAFIITLVATIGGCFAIQMLLSNPDYGAILAHFVPRDHEGQPSLFGRSMEGSPTVLGLHGESLFIAMGILGATVMPHNLYLHSALVQSRDVEATAAGRRDACKLNLVDSAIALNAALFVNLAILVLAAAAFHRYGFHEVGSLREAHRLLSPLLGSTLAPTLFAIALLCAGQASTVTGTLAGQIVMEGFLRVRVRPWLRRLVSRGLAIIPAVAVILWKGESGVDELLVLSQVALSLQLSFAVVPLITFTSDRRRMGAFVNPWWVQILAIIVAALIMGLNAKLAIDVISGWVAQAGSGWWVWGIVIPLSVGMGALLLYLVALPLFSRPQAEPVAAGTVPVTAGSRGVRGSGVDLDPEPLRWHSGNYRRIAVAVELAEADDNILQFLLRAHLAKDVELVFVHVAESAASRWLGERSHDSESREDLHALEGLAREFTDIGTRTAVRLGHGDPAREIARIVKEERADLLITGSHGHSGLSDVVFGATVSSVRHLVTCPILTVPPRRSK
ncbi:MAG: Nramp family divalent metal transporter [Candidatus Eisenbacteria bacterium]|nr:Nramp family divalent metal transporter [Candidatus Eisenbacteria bacterium]